jgi:type I restriction enzyme, S subunit
MSTYETKKLMEIGYVKTGVRQYSGSKRYFSTGSIKRNSFIAEGEYTYENRPSRANREIQEGDVIQARMQETNKALLISKDFDGSLFSTGFMQFRCNKEEIIPKFLYYFLSSDLFLEQKNALCSGSTQKAINDKNLKNISLRIPALSVQKKIVEKLDAAFADIDKLISATEKNIKNAQSILKSHINEIIKYNDDTEVIELGTVIDTLTDYHANGSYKILKKHVALKDDEDYAWMVRSTDFENNFQNDKKYITKSAYDFLKKSKIFGGELLMSKIGNAGKIYLMPEHNKPASLAMNMFLIRCDESTALNEYIFFCLSSYFGNQQINDRLKGAATLTITKDSVRSIEIPLISIEEQRNTISKITAIRKKTGSLEEIYRMKFKNLSALKLSILNHAFQGELTKGAA